MPKASHLGDLPRIQSAKACFWREHEASLAVHPLCVGDLGLKAAT